MVRRLVRRLVLAPGRELVLVSIDGLDQPLSATSDHPVYIAGRDRWIPASSLVPGDRVLILASPADRRPAPAAVLAVGPAPLPFPDPVRTLEVGGPEHAFFADGVLVHNKSVDEGWDSYYDDDDVSEPCTRPPVACTDIPDFATASTGHWVASRSVLGDDGFTVSFVADLCGVASDVEAGAAGVTGYGIGDDVTVKGGTFAGATASSTRLVVRADVPAETDEVALQFSLLCPGLDPAPISVRVTGLPSGAEGAAGLPVEVVAE